MGDYVRMMLGLVLLGIILFVVAVPPVYIAYWAVFGGQ